MVYPIQMDDKCFIIFGHNRTGKTTLANEINKKYRDTHQVFFLPFGAGLRSELYAAGFSPEYIAAKSPKARQLMRAFGDARREPNPNYYVDYWYDLYQKFDNTRDQFRPVVVMADDTYHLEEVRRMLRLYIKQTFLIAVERPGFAPSPEHISQFDSVRETEELMRMFHSAPNFDRIKILEKVQEVFHPYVSKTYTKTLFVDNAYNDLESYKQYLHEKILPNL